MCLVKFVHLLHTSCLCGAGGEHQSPVHPDPGPAVSDVSALLADGLAAAL